MKFGLKLEGNYYGINEFVVTKTTPIAKNKLKKDTHKSFAPYITLEEYSNASWKNGVLLIPFKNIQY